MTPGSPQVATDCDASHDAILDFFDCIESFLNLLRISTEIPSHLVVIEKAMKILFQLILVLAVATRQTQRNRLRELFSLVSPLAHLALEKVKGKLLNEEDIQRVLRRLSRLTQEETQMAVVQTMEVIYGLISNIRVVMDGA